MVLKSRVSAVKTGMGNFFGVEANDAIIGSGNKNDGFVNVSGQKRS
jgi:hypothetical protein